MPSERVLRLAFAAIRAGIRVPAAGLVQKYSDSVYLKVLLDRLRIDCVLDVGANKGQYATKLRAMGFAGHIVSFEPIARDCEVIRRAAQGDARWHVHNLALGATDGEQSFNVVGGDYTVFSSFLPPLPGQAPEGIEQVTVPVRRLAGLLEEIEATVGRDVRMFLKLDTQGYDLEVCKGVAERMDRFVGLQSELSVEAIYDGQPSYTRALDCYGAFGFALMNLSIVNRSRGSGIQEYDCLMARPEELT